MSDSIERAFLRGDWRSSRKIFNRRGEMPRFRAAFLEFEIT
jgi:hypothetical protein